MRKTTEKAVQEETIEKKEENFLEKATMNDEPIDSVIKLSKKDKEYLKSLADNRQVVSYLIDQYYQSQDFRIRAQNQARALIQGFDESDNEHKSFIETNLKFAVRQEALNKKYIDIITDSIPVCKWMKAIVGIGPVLSAVLYSSLDVREAKYSTQFMSYAGLNDNNNPWLGKEKAADLVKEAIAERNCKINDLITGITNTLEKDKFAVSEQNIYTMLHISAEKISTCIDDYDVKSIKKAFKGTEFDDAKLVREFYILLKDNNPVLINEALLFSSDPKYVGELVFSYISEKTTRSIDTIKKGCRTVLMQKHKKESDSKKDPKESELIPTKSSLESYLAKPPYNKDLKKTMFLIGDSFIKQRNRGSLYGKLYYQRLTDETTANEEGKYADQAARLLATKNYDKKTDTYKCLSEGKLSPSHLVSRARRYAVKLFLSHVHEAMYYDEYKTTPPIPYILEFGGHHDYIGPEVDYKSYLD